MEFWGPRKNEVRSERSERARIFSEKGHTYVSTKSRTCSAFGAEVRDVPVWVREGSNLRPLSYQDSVLPLNYSPSSKCSSSFRIQNFILNAAACRAFLLLLAKACSFAFAQSAPL